MTEDDLLELLDMVLPETLEGWLAIAIIACAILAIVLPAPRENAHPLLKGCHRLICLVGLGAGKMRATGRIGKIGKLFRGRK